MQHYAVYIGVLYVSHVCSVYCSIICLSIKMQYIFSICSIYCSIVNERIAMQHTSSVYCSIICSGIKMQHIFSICSIYCSIADIQASRCIIHSTGTVYIAVLYKKKHYVLQYYELKHHAAAPICLRENVTKLREAYSSQHARSPTQKKKETTGQKKLQQVFLWRFRSHHDIFSKAPAYSTAAQAPLDS